MCPRNCFGLRSTSSVEQGVNLFRLWCTGQADLLRAEWAGLPAGGEGPARPAANLQVPTTHACTIPHGSLFLTHNTYTQTTHRTTTSKLNSRQCAQLCAGCLLYLGRYYYGVLQNGCLKGVPLVGGAGRRFTARRSRGRRYLLRW